MTSVMRNLAAHLAEMESTAWKDERRFRIVVADRGAVSFCDLFFRRRSPAVPPPPMPRALRAQEAAAASASPPGRHFDIVALGKHQHCSPNEIKLEN